MKFYNFLFVGYYLFLKEIKDKDSIFGSIVFVAAAQVLHVILVLAGIELLTSRQFIPHYSERVYTIIVLAMWLCFVYIYYSKPRVEKLLKVLNQWSNKRKIFAAALALAVFIVPIVLIIVF